MRLEESKGRPLSFEENWQQVDVGLLIISRSQDSRPVLNSTVSEYNFLRDLWNCLTSSENNLYLSWPVFDNSDFVSNQMLPFPSTHVLTWPDYDRNKRLGIETNPNKIQNRTLNFW